MAAREDLRNILSSLEGEAVRVSFLDGEMYDLEIKSTARAVFGKGITSRRLSAPARIIAMRSRPRAMPPWGGVPYSRASRKNPKRARASSSVKFGTCWPFCDRLAPFFSDMLGF